MRTGAAFIDLCSDRAPYSRIPVNAQESVDGFESHISTRMIPTGGTSGAGVSQESMDAKAADELREREDIVASLKELTRYISVAGAGIALPSKDY